MPTHQCNCPHRRWAFTNVALNVLRILLMVWAFFQGLGHPAMVHQLTVILVRSAATIIIFVWQGVFY